MSDRYDFFFRQKVTEAELDGAFNALELADQNLVVDADLVGVHFGLAVAEQGIPNLTVAVSSGGAYDATGRRIRAVSGQTVDLSADYNGISTAVPTSGYERWLSIFIGFTRTLSDPRTDGNSLTVYFARAEAFVFRVVAGPEASAGTAARPALDSARILLADVLLANGATAVHTADISVSRRQDIFNINGVRKGRTKEAVTELAAQLLSHINSSVAHAASSITFAGAGTWADGSTNPASDVETQLDAMIDDLGGSSGTSKLGSGGGAGSYFFTMTPGILYDQLVQIAQYIDNGPLGLSSTVLTSNTTLSSHRQVYCDSSGGAFTITLPTPSPGRVIYIKDTKGSFTANPVTLAPSSGIIKIEGIAANRDLAANWGAYRVHSDGTDWYID